MVVKTVRVLNRAGVHARPAALIVQAASRFDSKIMLVRDTIRVNAKSIMGVMAMAAGCGSELELVVEGPDEVAALSAIERLFQNKFEEE
ncbi:MULTISPECIES: HPr family phosphocarrier protein [Treponema]|uniref:Phosphocarrier protein HPr n=6 Tax=Treponema TaxID=157 RepID=PTHP_TREPA|nr:MULTISPECIES: HPr family phosphocarrier protein [Treponema]O83598.1 RecName: Full=Phosphocarrier protein HPr; AltName: Full=Histidine-containing protein [Treponema pallidum subsp. pallidum str. Nichols]AAC65564.1 phosphocarrier protein HPr (ptsH) [Treponema pallidum subsp. pallidum str. Nichols]ACD71009.1 phosphocarrier protein HPr [Treponema pallidum subsp. pallidum SS14]ADD72698.1 phosphocarrier protein HPr [Treponema pallidum subsp. pallidum str. Chicago]AEH40528.1 HPr family phosphotran